MFNAASLDAMASQARTKLLNQQKEQQAQESQDLYAEFRDESLTSAQDVNSDNSEELPTLRRITHEDLESETLPTLETYEDEVQEITIDPYDQPIFEDGPTQSQVDLWKKEWEGYDIFVAEIASELFVARTLNRFEYKQLVALSHTNALSREEVICNTCVLWPMQYGFKEMAIAKGGIPSSLAQIIMENSGFTQDHRIMFL